MLKRTNTVEKDGEKRGIWLSDDEKHRYLLYRQWDESKPMLTYVMLNPSVPSANGRTGLTLTKCIGAAKKWSYGGIYIVNLFTLRAAKPKDLWASDELLQDQLIADATIMNALDKAKHIVCAWGAAAEKPLAKHRINHILTLVGINALGYKLRCLGLTKAGHPRHPLYTTITRLKPYDGTYEVPKF